MTYSSFFNKFPKIQYDINNNLYSNYETVTDIFLRIGVIQKVIGNISSYYVYELDDGDTPEILAEQVYGDAGAYWMILYANNMYDPQFDWVMSYDVFNQYIINKYGSIETAKTTIHHYEKVITRTLQPDNVTWEKRIVVNEEPLTDNNLDVPYEYYANGDYALAVTQYVETIDFSETGQTLTQISKGEAIYCYDYEYDLNEQKRLVKVIKKEYYLQILNELDDLTKKTIPYMRSVR